MRAIVNTIDVGNSSCFWSVTSSKVIDNRRSKNGYVNDNLASGKTTYARIVFPAPAVPELAGRAAVASISVHGK